MSRKPSRTKSWLWSVWLLALLIAPPVWAGPWTKDLGQFYVKLNEGFFIANAFRDSQGVVQTGTEYLGITTSLYYEVGVYRGLHLQGSIPYSVGINTEDGTVSGDRAKWLRAGGGDLLLGLQYASPWKLPIKAAVRLDFKVPLYDRCQPTRALCH